MDIEKGWKSYTVKPLLASVDKESAECVQENETTTRSNIVPSAMQAPER